MFKGFFIAQIIQNMLKSLKGIKEGYMKKLDNLLLISLDGMSDADIAILRNMPNFQRLFMLVNNVDSVFLTNTYPVHTSVITEVLS